MKLRLRFREYLYSFAVITGLWYMVSLLKLTIIPSPFEVYRHILYNFNFIIKVHVIYSFIRIFGGIIVSLIIGLPLGWLMGYYKKLDMLFTPLVYFTYPVPKLALLPIVMLLFGLGELSKIIMIVMIILFQIIISTRDAVKDIPKEMYNSFISLGASKFNIFRYIIVPATLPEVITSTRLALGTAISILFFTETFGTEFGMGFFIMDAWMRVSYIEMYSGIVILSLMGVAVFLLIDGLQHILCKWKA